MRISIKVRIPSGFGTVRRGPDRRRGESPAPQPVSPDRPKTLDGGAAVALEFDA